MIAIPLVAALLLGTPQHADTQPPKWTPEQLQQIKQKQEEFKKRYERVRQRAIHINDLAGNIHSDADARVYVDAVAEELTDHRHMSWTTRKIRHRVAHAEFESATDRSRQIPEQRIVDIWNEYVREIDAPEDALVTVAELHNLRDALYSAASQRMWKSDFAQSIWTMPNIYALDSDGKVASGCRALEALKIIHDMHETFPVVRIARDRVKKGILVSDQLKKREENGAPVVRSSASFAALQTTSEFASARPFAYRYQQAHGEHAYQQLLRRLFEELFPAE